MADQTVFIFTVNSNMSTYVTGDIIKVLYDDTASAIKVTKNGSPITSGDSFTEADYLNGVFTASKTNYSYCDSGTLISFHKDDKIFWEPSFPYYKLQYIEGAGSCTSTAGDILKYGLPVITPATDATTHDGTVKVEVTSRAAVKFWTAPFSYTKTGFAADSVSGDKYTYTFLNLAPGTRNLFARDANGWGVRWEVNVPIDTLATYGQKYYFDFEDRWNTTYRLILKKKGYSGGSSEIDNMAHEPIELEIGLGRSNTSVFEDLICSTVITTNLKSITDEQWVSEFSEVGDKEWLCEVRKDPSGSNTLLYNGFNVVNEYSEPLLNAPYNVKLRFTDGLGDLKFYTYTNKKYVKDINDPSNVAIENIAITGKSKAIEIIAFCLRQTGLEQNIRSCLNTYASGMNSTASDDPLDQLYINNDIFYDEGEPLDCEEVLKKILQSYPEYIRVTSGGGYWWLMPIQVSSSIDYREFDQYGVYSSNSSVSPLIDSVTSTNLSGGGTTVQIGGTLIMEPAYNKVRILKERKVAKNLFTDFTGKNLTTRYQNTEGVFAGWSQILNGQSIGWQPVRIDQNTKDPILTSTKTGKIDPESRKVKNSFKLGLDDVNVRDKYGLIFQGVDGEGATAYISYTGDVEFQESDRFQLQWDVYFDPAGELLSDTNPIYVPVRWMLKVGTYYYSIDGTWSTTVTINEYFLQSFNTTVPIVINGQSFRSGAAQQTQSYEFRIYDTDLSFYHYEGEVTGVAASRDYSNLISTVEGISTATLFDGARIVVRADFSSSSFYVNYYYRLAHTDSTASGIDRIEPTDNSDLKWVLEGSVKITSTNASLSRYIISDPRFITIPNGVEIEEIDIDERTLTEGDLFIKEFHLPISGAPLNINNSKRMILNLFTDSSDNVINYWGTDSKPIEEIQIDSIARQYKRPKRRMNYNGILNADIFGYKALRLPENDNKIFLFDTVSLELRSKEYQASVVEVSADTATTIDSVNTAAFTSGFRQ